MVTLVNYSTPTEGIHHTEPSIAIRIDERDFGLGTLYITESCVLWLNSSDLGVQLAYKLISLHAISRDLSSFPHEHLLLHYEGTLPGESEMNGHNGVGTDHSQSDEDDPSDMPEDEGNLIEIRFVPQNKESLESMFQAMSNCQTLHPDEDCQLSDEDEYEDAEEDQEFYVEEDGVANLSEEGRANLQHLNNLLERGQGDGDLVSQTRRIHISNGHSDEQVHPSDADQFEDAEEMDQ